MDQPLSSDPRRLVVIGAGHGGGSLVAFARQQGFTGPITLIGDEQRVPYHRPPLSKAWLKGDVAQDQSLLRPEAFYREQGVSLRLGEPVRSLDAAARCVTLARGERIPYDLLVLATGATPRALPLDGARHANVLSLRNFTDAESLRAQFVAGRRLVVVGGGYIGLECAATARALGLDVTVIERLPRLLERVASAPIASFLHRHHEQRGVRIVTGAAVAAIDGDDRARSVRLADGRVFECDVVLVGIGAVPATALAESAGVACENGVRVDADCRTSDPHIFAIGDVAHRPHPLYGRGLRLESVPSSIEQARHVASVITGSPAPKAEVPWFWSDQYALKLQIAGLPFEVDELVVRGDPASGPFAVFHISQGRVVTVESVEAAAEFMAGRKLIAAGKPVDRERLANRAVPLNALLA